MPFPTSKHQAVIVMSDVTQQSKTLLRQQTIRLTLQWMLYRIGPESPESSRGCDRVQEADKGQDSMGAEHEKQCCTPASAASDQKHAVSDVHVQQSGHIEQPRKLYIPVNDEPLPDIAVQLWRHKQRRKNGVQYLWDKAGQTESKIKR